jgi:hypothetical protein
MGDAFLTHAHTARAICFPRTIRIAYDCRVTRREVENPTPMNYVVTVELANQYGLSLGEAAQRLIEPLARLDILVETGSGNAGLRYPPGPRPPLFVEKLGEANRVVHNVLGRSSELI